SSSTMISELRIVKLTLHRIARSSRFISTTTGLRIVSHDKYEVEGDGSGSPSSPSDLKSISYARVKKTALAGSLAGNIKSVKPTKE
ncbi:hypothetical protein HPB47_004158, partial [Ixodes persulcatus]